MYVQSDPTNLYILGDTTDDDDGTAGASFDIFDINIGLQGNPAWRYRIRAKNMNYEGSWDAGYQLQGAWYGDWTFGLDTVGGTWGEPGGNPGDPHVTAVPGSVQWVVALDTDGQRTHEIGIPWALLVDGQNGWDPNSTLDLGIAGFYAADGGGYTSVPGDVDYTDLGTWGPADDIPSGAGGEDGAPVPEPATVALLATGLLGLAHRRR